MGTSKGVLLSENLVKKMLEKKIPCFGGKIPLIKMLWVPPCQLDQCWFMTSYVETESAPLILLPCNMKKLI